MCTLLKYFVSVNAEQQEVVIEDREGNVVAVCRLPNPGWISEAENSEAFRRVRLLVHRANNTETG